MRGLGKKDLEQLYGPENASQVITLDLTIAHTDQDPLVVEVPGGLSVAILDMGGAPWELRFDDPGNDPYPSSLLRRGEGWEQAFFRLIFTNEAAPAGTPPAVFHAGRRVV